MTLMDQLILVCPMLLIAGIIDGAVGGGGVLALPAYLMTGMPMQFAYGCNKLQSCLGTSVSAFRYFKSDLIDIKVAGVASVLAVIGSYISTKIILMLSDDGIKTIVLICMPIILILMFLKRKLRGEGITKIEFNRKNFLISLIIGLVLGLYDGIFGPGGGTISMILFAVLLNYDMRVGCGNGKILIIVSNLIALISYITKGAILYEIAIPATISNIVGCYIGTGLAIKKGDKIVMPFTILVVAILIGQTIFKLI